MCVCVCVCTHSVVSETLSEFPAGSFPSAQQTDHCSQTGGVHRYDGKHTAVENMHMFLISNMTQ